MLHFLHRQINIYADIEYFNALFLGYLQNNLIRPYWDYQFISGEIYPIISRFFVGFRPKRLGYLKGLSEPYSMQDYYAK